jgi:uncharacterized SAM-binding protein YcdF (DUF218 family)
VPNAPIPPDVRSATIVLLGVLFTGIIIYSARTPILIGLASYLIVQDPLEPAGAIVVLSGGHGDERVRQAAALYRRRLAPLVVLSGAVEVGGITVADLMRLQASRHGIPQSALLLETKSTSTRESALFVRPLLERRGIRRAIVVTSSFHTKRSRYIFRKVFRRSPVQIRIYPVQRDVFDPTQWWKSERDTEDLVLEYVKLAVSLFR